MVDEDKDTNLALSVNINASIERVKLATPTLLHDHAVI